MFPSAPRPHHLFLACVGLLATAVLLAVLVATPPPLNTADTTNTDPTSSAATSQTHCLPTSTRPNAPVVCRHANPNPNPAHALPTTATLKRRVNALLAAIPAAHQLRGTSCIGDGHSGPRFQVLYAHRRGAPNRLPSLRGLFHQIFTAVDATFLASARRGGGALQPRWVTNRCVLDIRSVAISDTAARDFGQMRTELMAAGYTRADRKYVVMADTTGNPWCGMGETLNDTRIDNNANDTGAYVQFARIEAACWGLPGSSAEVHEMAHTLGAVADAAPHATGKGHCTDESDRLCYSDGGRPVRTGACPTHQEWLLDCGHDDYFAPNPRAGTWVARHWNIARSSWLTRPAAPTARTQTHRVQLGTRFTLTSPRNTPSAQQATYTWQLPGCRVLRQGQQARAVCPATWTPRPGTLRVQQADGQAATGPVSITASAGRLTLSPRLTSSGRLAVKVLTDNGRPVRGIDVIAVAQPVAGGPIRQLGQATTGAAGKARISTDGLTDTDRVWAFTPATGSFPTTASWALRP